jgi:hypothetical protein
MNSYLIYYLVHHIMSKYLQGSPYYTRIPNALEKEKKHLIFVRTDT